MSTKLLFLTSANLSTNPRLVKEIDSLKANYEIDVVLFRTIHWSSAFDEKMRTERKDIRFILLDVSKANIFQWLFWATMEKACRIIYPFFKNSLLINACALSRKSLKIACSINKNKVYALIIAHNLPALYPAYKLSKKWKIPFAFDVEDYDPGMVFDNSGKHYKEICTTLYQKMLPSASYITSSSPLIEKYTLKLLKKHPKHITIINSFPKNEFVRPIQISKSDGILKFVWFSQTISFRRGLEEFFETFTEIKERAELTLIGHLDKTFESMILIKYMKNLQNLKIFIKNPMTPLELHKELSRHHIGIALENPRYEFNRAICLTNKILAYAQAGNYILASNTPAQTNFLNKNPQQGIICELSKSSIKHSIETIFNNREKILREATQRFESAAYLAWENQIPVLKELIVQCLKNEK